MPRARGTRRGGERGGGRPHFDGLSRTVCLPLSRGCSCSACCHGDEASREMESARGVHARAWKRVYRGQRRRSGGRARRGYRRAAWR